MSFFSPHVRSRCVYKPIGNHYVYLFWYNMHYWGNQTAANICMSLLVQTFHFQGNNILQKFWQRVLVLLLYFTNEFQVNLVPQYKSVIWVKLKSSKKRTFYPSHSIVMFQNLFAELNPCFNCSFSLSGVKWMCTIFSDTTMFRTNVLNDVLLEEYLIQCKST